MVISVADIAVINVWWAPSWLFQPSISDKAKLNDNLEPNKQNQASKKQINRNLDSNEELATKKLAAKIPPVPSKKTTSVRHHADQRGVNDYNMRLSKKRAQTVFRYLKSRGVVRSRIQVRGFGASRPLREDHNPQAWAQNRRVVIWIKKDKP